MVQKNWQAGQEGQLIDVKVTEKRMGGKLKKIPWATPFHLPAEQRQPRCSFRFIQLGDIKRSKVSFVSSGPTIPKDKTFLLNLML